MNKKDMAKLRKAFGKEEGCPIVRIASCYVDASDGEPRIQETRLFARSDDEEEEQYRAFFKKAVTGKPGSTAVEIEPEDRFLDELVRSGLEDESLVRDVFEKIAQTYASDESFGIFAAYGAYDVPKQASDGSESYDESDETYEFVLIMIQPCALSKAGIVYDASGNRYKDRKKDRPLGAPSHSFLYPSFDEGHADSSRAACFSKNEKLQAEASPLAEVLFGTGIPLTAKEQKDGFAEMMTAGFGASIPYDAVRDAYERFSEIRAESESEGAEAALTISELKDIIKESGVEGEERGQALEEAAAAYEGRKFSLDAIAPKNVSVSTDAATVKIDLNEMAGLEVIEYKGRRCLAVPLYGASVENMNVK